MARKSNIARDLKRKNMIAKTQDKRQELKNLGDQDGLALLPPNSSPSRHKNRCNICGRSNAYMRDFGLCRICFREHASRGEIPGVIKSSW